VAVGGLVPSDLVNDDLVPAGWVTWVLSVGVVAITAVVAFLTFRSFRR
jgi:multisubunit Na+/H+ antiporter MnhB subunit